MSTTADLLVLLRLKGLARTGTVDDGAIAALVADGRAEATRLGYRLTPAGRTEADLVWVGEQARADAGRLAEIYRRFEAINAPFKALVADWQLRAGNPNDHSDQAYDSAVLARLDPLAAALDAILVDLTAAVPRMSRYSPAFTAARAALAAGQTRWFSGPMVDSVHTLWFELHEELIHLTGRTRAGEAAAGRAA